MQRKLLSWLRRIPIVRDTLGVACYRAGDFPSAVRELRHVRSSCRRIRGGHLSASDCFVLAMAYHQQGEIETARKWYEAASAWQRKYPNDETPASRPRPSSCWESPLRRSQLPNSPCPTSWSSIPSSWLPTPKRPGSMCCAGHCLDMRGESEQAASDFRKAIELYTSRLEVAANETDMCCLPRQSWQGLRLRWATGRSAAADFTKFSGVYTDTIVLPSCRATALQVGDGDREGYRRSCAAMLRAVRRN